MTFLPPVPVLDLREATAPAASACQALPSSVDDLVESAVRHYTPIGVAVGDRLSRHWLARNATPYRDEVDSVARQLRRSGGHLLNASFEWACTTGITPAAHGGMSMVRVLDWNLDGLGRNLLVTRQRGPAGDWMNVGWPGFVGCITGIAPGRFAAAINQPPLPETSLGGAARRRGWRRPAMGADWLAERPATWKTRALPPAHLLRRAMDEARDFDEAVSILSSEAVACPALFALAGPRSGQGVVIERTRNDAALRWATPSVAMANHWDAMAIKGAPRWRDSAAREHCILQGMAALGAGGPNAADLSWLKQPVLNEITRVACIMDPGEWSLCAEGFEADGPATARLLLDSRNA